MKGLLMVVRAKKASAARKSMSQVHKDALAKGREQGRVVRAYLEALEAHKPKRGRKRTKESITRQLADIEAQLDDANPLVRVLLIQQRLDLSAELEVMASGGVDLGALEASFVKIAADYSNSKGVTYQAWRAVGVDADVLRKAGIGRSAN
jgi:hypothetical protein